MTPPRSHAALRRMRRPCAATTSPTADASDASGASAMQTTRRAAAWRSASRGPDSGPGAAGHWTENVAPRVMLRICDWVLSHGRLAASTQHNASARGGLRDAPRRFRAGAPPRPRCRGGMPLLPVQRAAPGPLLDGGRRSQYARPVDVRPAQRTGIRSRRRRALDRCGLVRIWRSPRRDPRELRFHRLPRCRR